MKKYLLLLVCLGLIACGSSETIKRLNIIFDYIQEDPERAYDELSDIKPDALKSNQERGLYSLLFSMAMDKNYVDIKSDSVVNAAVRYYSNHGDNLKKFLSLYYQGRVYENAENYDLALASFIKAQSIADNSVSNEYKVRILASKKNIYIHQYAVDKALESITQAKEIAKSIPDPRYYLAASLDRIELMDNESNRNEAQDEIKELLRWMTEKDVLPVYSFYQIILRINLLNPDISKDSLNTDIHNYILAADQEGRELNGLLLAEAYSKIEDYNRAIRYQEQIDYTSLETLFNKALYHLNWFDIYQGMGNYPEAISSRLKYEEITANIHLSIFNNDIRFMEERYKTGLEQQQSKYTRNCLILAVIALVIGLIATSVFLIKKNNRNKAIIDSFHSEYALLKELSLDKETTAAGMDKLLNVRLEALRPYLGGGERPSVFNRAELDKLQKDRSEILTSISMMYALSFPRFVSELLKYKLTTEEIGICCMYVAGFRTKDLTTAKSFGDAYHINTDIRRKIGDKVADRTLPIWLKELFKSLT